MQKTINEMANFIKKLMPSDTLEGYTLNPMLEIVASEKKIWNGVFAFKNFLYKLYDHLITNGGLYEKPFQKPKNNNSGHGNVVSLSVGCPFINDVTSILINIGYYSILSENGDSMVFENWQSLTSVIGPQGGKIKQNISAVKVFEILRLLTLCGLNFNGIDLNVKKADLTKLSLSVITYPNNPVMLTGFKVMAIVHNELSTKNDYYVFQRCDYRILIKKIPDATFFMKEYIHLIPEKAQDFVLTLHQSYIDAGLVCKMKMHYFSVIFSYSYKNNTVWEFIPSPDGCYIFIKAKNMNKYADDINNFHIILQNKISNGYGCDKKRFGEPCQKGCHGFRFLLDDSILDVIRDIKIWLDKEISCLQIKVTHDSPFENPC